jgi:hypothetical protein
MVPDGAPDGGAANTEADAIRPTINVEASKQAEFS